MKITMIITLIFLLLPGAKAQDVHFGAKGGINISSLNSERYHMQSKLGLNAGAFAHIHASVKWAVQPELIFSTEGGKETLIGSDVTEIHRLNYLNVPVLLQYMFRNGLRLEGGPQLGFLITAKSKTGNTITNQKSNYQTTAISIPLGISLLTRKGIGLDARYVFGLSNINKANDPLIQSNVFQFGIFYQHDKWKN